MTFHVMIIWKPQKTVHVECSKHWCDLDNRCRLPPSLAPLEWFPCRKRLNFPLRHEPFAWLAKPWLLLEFHNAMVIGSAQLRKNTFLIHIVNTTLQNLRTGKQIMHRVSWSTFATHQQVPGFQRSGSANGFQGWQTNGAPLPHQWSVHEYKKM